MHIERTHETKIAGCGCKRHTFANKYEYEYRAAEKRLAIQSYLYVFFDTYFVIAMAMVNKIECTPTLVRLQATTRLTLVVSTTCCGDNDFRIATLRSNGCTRNIGQV